MEKINYENITTEDLEEEVEIEPHPEGGMPVYCTICDVKMDKIKINVKRENIMFLDIDAYKCPQCGEEVLDIDTASLLEREFALRNVENSAKYELNLLKDGTDYLLLLPKELVNKMSKVTRVELFSISGDECLLRMSTKLDS